jgi:hypothetical protein
LVISLRARRRTTVCVCIVCSARARDARLRAAAVALPFARPPSSTPWTVNYSLVSRVATAPTLPPSILPFPSLYQQQQQEKQHDTTQLAFNILFFFFFSLCLINVCCVCVVPRETAEQTTVFDTFCDTSVCAFHSAKNKKGRKEGRKEKLFVFCVCIDR